MIDDGANSNGETGMSGEALAAALAFVIWIATAAILDAMKAAARQRESIYSQLGRVAEKLDTIANRVSGLGAKLPSEPSKPIDPDSWWSRTFDGPSED